MEGIAIPLAVAAVELGLKLLPSFKFLPRPDLDGLLSGLETMKAFLRDAEGVDEDQQKELYKRRVLQIRDLAYEIEDIVAKFQLEVPQHFHRHSVTKVFHYVAHPLLDWGAYHRFSLAVKKVDDKISKIRYLDDFLVRFGHSDSSHGASNSLVAGPSAPVPCQVPREHLIGIDRRASAIEHRIMEEDWRLVVVSVVGSHGSGKTTILKEVFKRLKENDSFKCCIWIEHQSASSVEDMLEIVVDAVVRAQPQGSAPVPREMGIEDRLVYLLQKKRYALIFDGNIAAAWSHVISLLPDHLEGSRVIVSTREKDTASHCARFNGCISYVHEVESLTWKESWKLLCKIAFQAEECPDHLVDWTEKLLFKCEGLPVAVVGMGRLLLKTPQTPREFKRLHDSLGRHQLGGHADLSMVWKISIQAYYQLSHHKKRCFLYFSIFPESCSVTRGKLIRLWITERFVEEQDGGKILEEEAEEYLNELIKVGLVLVSRRDFEGNVRSCRVQNLLLQFILSMSEKEEFCSVLPGSNTAPADKIRRLSLRGVNNDSFRTDMDWSRVRSLVTFTSELETLPRKLLHNFSLVMVLDFENANLQDFPEGIVKLGLLRHLSLRNTKVKSIPKSIGKLQNLMYLDLRQTLVTNLPGEIYKLQELVDLLVSHRDSRSFQGLEVIPPGIKQLVSLQKLSLVKANSKNWRSFAEELKCMTKLKKLGIYGILTREDGNALCDSLVGMTNLYSLQVISATNHENELVDLEKMQHLVYPSRIPCPIRSLYWAGRLPTWISSLDSLAKLRLRWSRLTSAQLEPLRSLPCLVELKLAEDAYAGNHLEIMEGWFGSLKNLELEDLGCLRIVEVCPGAMPQLTNFTARRCENLARPLGLENLKNLEPGDLRCLERLP